MNKYEEITAARELLELPETADQAMIKSNFKRLLTKWHPDTHPEDQDQRNEMTRKIISAYQLIMDYCLHYKFSFSEEAVKDQDPLEDWWIRRFGDQSH